MKTNRWLTFVVLVAVSLALNACSKKSSVKGPIPPGDYIVLEEDDLSNVAVRAYGSMDLWYCLLNANPQLAKRPRFSLEVGETLHIPEQSKLDRKLPKSIFPTTLPADYIVMPGDSLHFIAKGCYGDRELWPIIYEANRSTLSERVKEDTRRLIAGQVLHIPAKPSQGAQTSPSSSGEVVKEQNKTKTDGE